MKVNKTLVNGKVVSCGVLMLILSLIFMSGCGAKQKTYVNGVISAAGLESIANSESISITDDSPAGMIWTPKDNKDTSSKVATWLQNAKLYKGVIPKSTSLEIVNANIEPSCLFIHASAKRPYVILPAYYILKSDIAGHNHFISDVLKLTTSDNKTLYIKSKELFSWLKNDKWEPEFKE